VLTGRHAYTRAREAGGLGRAKGGDGAACVMPDWGGRMARIRARLHERGVCRQVLQTKSEDVFVRIVSDARSTLEFFLTICYINI